MTHLTAASSDDDLLAFLACTYYARGWGECGRESEGDRCDDHTREGRWP